VKPRRGRKRLESSFTITWSRGSFLVSKYNINNLWEKQILIDNKQHYKIMGRNIDMISLIKLYVEDGKIVRHEDW